jgi:accessory gene regulator B
MPEIDDERAEVIDYGLHLMVGEIPKNFILLLLAYILGVFELSLLALLTILPYKTFSGGVHLKTHIGCMTATSIAYIGNSYISKLVTWDLLYIKHITVFAIWIFAIFMIKLYAPADTENVPILRKQERKTKKILSYITMTLTLVVSIFINNEVISNILIFGTLIQTITITRAIYKLTNNKYGYEEYYRNNPVENLT